MGTLLDQLHAESERFPGPACSIEKAYATHPKLADEITAAILDRSHSIAAVARVFAANDIDITGNTISRHRLNECQNCKRAGRTW